MTARSRIVVPILFFGCCSFKAVAEGTQFGLRILTVCGTEDTTTMEHESRRTGDVCDNARLKIDVGSIIIATIYDPTGACEPSTSFVSLGEATHIDIPWCVGKHVVRIGSDCLDGSAAFAIPSRESAEVLGESVLLNLHPRPCGAPQSLYVDRDGDQYLSDWELAETPARGVRVWWQPAESRKTVMVEAALKRGSTAVITQRTAVPVFGDLGVTPLYSNDWFTVVSVLRSRSRVPALRSAVDEMKSTVEHRCYASCPRAAELVKVVFQVLDGTETRWLVRRVPPELLEEAGTGEGLVTLLRYVAVQDAAWDASIPERDQQGRGGDGSSGHGEGDVPGSQ